MISFLTMLHVYHDIIQDQDSWLRFLKSLFLQIEHSSIVGENRRRDCRKEADDSLWTLPVPFTLHSNSS